MLRNNFTRFVSLGVLYLLPGYMYADGGGSLIGGEAGQFGTFADGVIDLVNNYLIPLLIGIAVLLFIWGVTKYFILGSDNEDSRKEGRSLMLYAIIGFVAIVALWGIVTFVAGAIGVNPGESAPGAPAGPSSSGGSGGGDGGGSLPTTTTT